MKISTVVKKMIIIMIAAALVFIAVGIIFSFFYPILLPVPFAIGVIISTLINIAKVIWLEQAVERAALMDNETTAGNYIKMQYMLRFGLTAAVLIITALVSNGPDVIWGAVVGLFTFHPAKYALSSIAKTDEKSVDGNENS